jgi:hypothetical protein
MRRGWQALAILLVAGCRADGPEILRHAEFPEHAAVESAGPIDPASTLLTVHEDGRVTEQGRPLTGNELRARIDGSTETTRVGLREAPILLEVPAAGRTGCLRETLRGVFSRNCVNLSFLVSTPGGLGALQWPVVADA